MRTLAFVFPGQGAEVPGMGLDLAKAYAPAQALLEQASDALAEDLPRLLQRGSRRLRDTDVLQPAITAVSLGALARLKQLGLEPAIVAGHSLGELSAWCATAAISMERCLDLAVARGAAMFEQARATPGGMVAYHDITRSQLEALLQLGRSQGVLDIAAQNAARRWVLSGDEAALEAIMSHTPGLRLPTTGPWHSSLMAGAMGPFAEALEGILELRAAAAFQVTNHAGQITPPEEIPAALLQQLVSPVQWRATMLRFGELAVTDIVTVGLDKALRGLLRANLGPHTQLHPAQRPADIEGCARRLLREDGL